MGNWGRRQIGASRLLRTRSAVRGGLEAGEDPGSASAAAPSRARTMAQSPGWTTGTIAQSPGWTAGTMDGPVSSADDRPEASPGSGRRAPSPMAASRVRVGGLGAGPLKVRAALTDARSSRSHRTSVLIRRSVSAPSATAAARPAHQPGYRTHRPPPRRVHPRPRRRARCPPPPPRTPGTSPVSRSSGSFAE